MAIGLLFEIPGMTQEQYDAAVEAGGQGTLPPGQIFHMAGPMEGGWRVIDLWETRADFDRFAEETLAPAMGGQVPVPVELPIHAFQVGGVAARSFIPIPKAFSKSLTSVGGLRPADEHAVLDPPSHRPTPGIPAQTAEATALATAKKEPKDPLLRPPLYCL